MAAEFATKLRLTAAVLGCDSQKALCARFRSVNPRTHFEIERAAKWLQGRATPRNRDVYDDWVKVLGIERDSHWIMDCPVEAFLDEVSRLFGIDADMLRRRASQWEPVLPVDGESRAGGAHHYLCGAFACYSWSWSPYHHGQIIRGGLRIAPAARRNAALAATYSEKLLGGSVRFSGDVLLAGRTLHMDVREPGHGPPLFLSLFLPGPPASVMCGMLSGATYVGHEPQPSATPFIAVRVPNDPEASNRYLDVTPDVFVADLASLGLGLAAPDDVDARMRHVLLRNGTPGCWQLSAADQANLTVAFDQSYVAAD